MNVMTGTWQRITIRQYERIRAALRAALCEEPMDGRGWRLTYRGEPVAVWESSLRGNRVTARVP